MNLEWPDYAGFPRRVPCKPGCSVIQDDEVVKAHGPGKIGYYYYLFPGRP